MNVEEAANKVAELFSLAINTFSINANRDLVPPDLNNYEEESLQEFSLVHLCCDEVTRNTTFLKEISTCLPINRYPELMKEAIYHEYHQSAAFLISTWPSTIISMSEVVCGVLDTSRILVRRGIGIGNLVLVAKGLSVLLELFLDIMQNSSSLLLRVLDLRGLYLAEKMLSKLIQVSTSTSTDVTRNYHFIIDCEIRTNEVVTQLKSLLENHRDSRQIKARLHINRLDISLLDETVSWELLELIDSEELIGLRIPPVYSAKFINFVLKKFSSLTALGISLENIYFLESRGESLSLQLNRLRRLKLCSGCNDLSAIIPTSILEELECLDIENFRHDNKIADDLVYLSTVPLRLQELKITGFNVVKSHLDLWRNLLQSLAPTLNMLQLSECFENDNHFESIVTSLLFLVNLRFLKLNENELTMKTLLEHATKLGALPRLRIITLPYKYTEEELENNNIPDDDPDNLKREDIDERFATERSPPVFVHWIPAPSSS